MSLDPILCVGIDLGGTNARLQVFNDALHPISEARARVRERCDPEEICQTLCDLLKGACLNAHLKPEHIQVIGMGLAGQLSRDGRTVKNAPNLGWLDVAFARIFEEAVEWELGVTPPVYVFNDLNALVYDEWHQGVARDLGDVLGVYVGTGVGGAIIAGGQLIRGQGNNAAEIGHVKVVPEGRVCGCGQRGCLEAYAGGRHLEARVSEVLNAHPTLQKAHPELGGEVLRLSAVDPIAEKHPALSELWEQTSDLLALSLANACTLLNPAALILGGGVLDHCPNLRRLVVDKTLPLVLDVARRELQILQPLGGPESGPRGAAALAMQELATPPSTPIPTLPPGAPR
ncbi:ROK family protein [Lujinxingia vulgaris]|uniref:ROK family protein n=1 Tax=Lujinxingia vulgaris TaxID=2600176 RepID=A0A5C6XJ62_9DELT|nr:ROK family protein [Lujinxingia vulgaris]TXD37292.1 ROK family protein [Lujinxingia vulgaris]